MNCFFNVDEDDILIDTELTLTNVELLVVLKALNRSLKSNNLKQEDMDILTSIIDTINNSWVFDR
jgi:hypothetical protein